MGPEVSLHDAEARYGERQVCYAVSDVKAMANLLSRIEIRRFPIDVKLTTINDAVRVVMQVRERDSGSELEVASDNFVTDSGLDFFRQVRQLVIDHIAHELDECFYVDGERMFDPHLKEV